MTQSSLFFHSPNLSFYLTFYLQGIRGDRSSSQKQVSLSFLETFPREEPWTPAKLQQSQLSSGHCLPVPFSIWILKNLLPPLTSVDRILGVCLSTASSCLSSFVSHIPLAQYKQIHCWEKFWVSTRTARFWNHRSHVWDGREPCLQASASAVARPTSGCCLRAHASVVALLG